MSEIMAEIGSEVKRFLNGERDDIYRQLSRSAIISAYGSEIEIEQDKILSPEDTKLVQAKGPETLTSPDWFNDVEWMRQPGEPASYRRLSLDAAYPTEYFKEAPTAGTFSGDKWLDKYGSISGFGSDGKVEVWRLDFVAPGSRVVTHLRHPDDPTAIDQYNARYQQYLKTLTEADPTTSYYRSWDRRFSPDANKASSVLGGMSLAGFGIDEIVKRGSQKSEKSLKCVRLLLHYEPEQNGYVGRDIFIDDDSEAITEPYWDGEDAREKASEKLLSTALALVRDTTKA
jgi:hypothetical protein